MNCDLHIHSAASFDCAMSLKTIVRLAKKRGLDAVAVADHDVPPGHAGELEGITVLPAAEYSSTYGHVLALFLTQSPDQMGIFKNEKGRYPCVALVNAIHEAGGIAVLAHPFAYSHNPPPEILALFDGLETCNSRAGYRAHGNANPRALAALSPGQFQSAGSDAHLPFEVGRSYLSLPLEGPLTKESFLAAAPHGQTHSRPTPLWVMAVSQLYKAFRLKQYGIIPKNILKFFYGLACQALPRLFDISPYSK